MKERRILIVDDEVSFTNIVKLSLELNGRYEVCVENDPRSEIRKFWEEMPAPGGPLG